MSKAILVMDMPESCSKCKFIYEFQGTKKCHLMNVFNGGFSRISQNNFTVKRHEECPLVQMPDKAYHPEFWDNGRYDKGWNDCIDEIMKGSGTDGNNE